MNVQWTRSLPTRLWTAATPCRFDVRLKALVTAFLTVGGLIAAAPAAYAAPPSCPHGTPGPGGRAIYGTAGNDHITGTPGDDYICAGPGDDVVDGGGGNDHIYGGPGRDRLSGGPGNDWVEGGDGGDFLYGDAGSDQIFGDAGPAFEQQPSTAPGNDIIWGGKGGDVINAGPGNDIVFAGGDGESRTGFDTVHGGPGNDVIMSDIRYTTFSDQFFGDEGDDLLWPNPFRTSPLGNTVWGGAGSDVIITANILQDGVELNEPKGLKIPIGSSCGVTIPVLKDKPIGSNFSATCGGLPGKVKAQVPPALRSQIKISGTIGPDGKPKLNATFNNSLFNLKVSDLQSISGGGFTADTCICDPKSSDWPIGDLVGR